MLPRGCHSQELVRTQAMAKHEQVGVLALQGRSDSGEVTALALSLHLARQETADRRTSYGVQGVQHFMAHLFNVCLAAVFHQVPPVSQGEGLHHGQGGLPPRRQRSPRPCRRLHIFQCPALKHAISVLLIWKEPTYPSSACSDPARTQISGRHYLLKLRCIGFQIGQCCYAGRDNLCNMFRQIPMH